MEKVLPKTKTLFRTGIFHIFGSSVINKIIAFMGSMYYPDGDIFGTQKN